MIVDQIETLSQRYCRTVVDSKSADHASVHCINHHLGRSRGLDQYHTLGRSNAKKLSLPRSSIPEAVELFIFTKLRLCA